MVRYHSYWSTPLVFLSLGLSILGALTGVMLMDQRRETKSPRIKSLLTLGTAVAFGGVGLYGMNTVAIVSLELKTEGGRTVPMGYDVQGLFFVFLAAVVFVYVGLLVASTDRFFGMTREERLKELISDVKRLTSNNITVKRLMREVEYRALFGDLRRIAMGGCLTVFGIYIVAAGGIGAMNGNITFHPTPGGIVGIIVLPFFTATFAYWIIFRVNEWRRKESWLRIFSAIILGVAFAFTRSVVYVGAKYYSTDSLKRIYVNKTNVTLFTVTASLLYSLVCLTAMVILQRNFMLDVQEDLGNLHRFYLQLRTFSNRSTGIGSDDPTYMYRVEVFLQQFGIMMAKRADRSLPIRSNLSGSDWSDGDALHTDKSCAPLWLSYCFPGQRSGTPYKRGQKIQPYTNQLSSGADAAEDGGSRGAMSRSPGQFSGDEYHRLQQQLQQASSSVQRSRAPSILLSSVLPDFRPGASILSTIIEEEDDSEVVNLADSGSSSERDGGGPIGMPASRRQSVPSAGSGDSSQDILPGEVVIKVKQVNETTIVVTQTSNVDGSLRKKSIKYECVDQEEKASPREAPSPVAEPEPKKKEAFSTTLHKLKKDFTSGNLFSDAASDGPASEAIKLPGSAPGSDASALPSSQLDDLDLEALAHISLGLLEGRSNTDSMDTAVLEMAEAARKNSIPKPMLVFSSSASPPPSQQQQQQQQQQQYSQTTPTLQLSSTNRCVAIPPEALQDEDTNGEQQQQQQQQQQPQAGQQPQQQQPPEQQQEEEEEQQATPPPPPPPQQQQPQEAQLAEQKPPLPLLLPVLSSSMSAFVPIATHQQDQQDRRFSESDIPRSSSSQSRSRSSK